MSRLNVETLDFLEGMFASKCGKGGIVLSDSHIPNIVDAKIPNQLFFCKRVEIVLPLDLSSRQKSGNIPRG